MRSLSWRGGLVFLVPFYQVYIGKRFCQYWDIFVRGFYTSSQGKQKLHQYQYRADLYGLQSSSVVQGEPSVTFSCKWASYTFYISSSSPVGRCIHYWYLFTAVYKWMSEGRKCRQNGQLLDKLTRWSDFRQKRPIFPRIHLNWWTGFGTSEIHNAF